MKKINKKILIVEDDSDFLSILENAFSKEGFEVVSAKDGEKGLLVTEKEKPDLIILDILMPKVDGITMAKELKKSNTNIPIIFLTNVKGIDYVGKAMETIEADYIVKTDVHLSDIVARVKNKLNINL